MKSLIAVLISLLCLSGCYTLFPEYMARKEAEELQRQQDIKLRNKQIDDSTTINIKQRPQLIVRKWKGDFVKTQPISLSEKIHCDTLDIRANGSYRLIIESKEQSEGKWRLSSNNSVFEMTEKRFDGSFQIAVQITALDTNLFNLSKWEEHSTNAYIFRSSLTWHFVPIETITDSTKN